MKRIIMLALSILCISSTMAYAVPDNFLGIKFDGTEEQCSSMTKLPDGSYGDPKQIYYRSENMQLEGTDLGSVYWGFNKETGKFASANIMMQFFESAKRSKVIKMPDGNYQMMGQLPLADEYFELLCIYFNKHYGKSTTETVKSGNADITAVKWDLSKDGLFINVNLIPFADGKNVMISAIVLKVK